MGGVPTESSNPRLGPALDLERLLRKSNAPQSFFDACLKGILLLRLFIILPYIIMDSFAISLHV